MGSILCKLDKHHCNAALSTRCWYKNHCEIVTFSDGCAFYRFARFVKYLPGSTFNEFTLFEPRVHGKDHINIAPLSNNEMIEHGMNTAQIDAKILSEDELLKKKGLIPASKTKPNQIVPLQYSYSYTSECDTNFVIERSLSTLEKLTTAT